MNFKRYINEVVDKDQQLEVDTENNSIYEIADYLNLYFEKKYNFSPAVIGIGNKTIMINEKEFKKIKDIILPMLKEIGFKYQYIYDGRMVYFSNNFYEKNNAKEVKPINESLDKLHSAVEKIIKDMQRKGNVKPEQIADRVQKALKLDLTREEIIRRYIRTLGGQFDSQM